jgi:tetratricopeptide (TPR) repeat protein
MKSAPPVPATRPAPWAAFEQAVDRLQSDPRDAERRAKAALRLTPRNAAAALVLARVRRRNGAPGEAATLIDRVARAQPGNPLVQYELGMALAALGQNADAVAAFKRAIAARPDMAIAWRALGDQLFLSGDLALADEAYGRYVAAPIGEALLEEADAMIARGEATASESILRRHLADHPHDVKALGMLAYAFLSREAFAEAAVVLEPALERHPGFVSARHGRALAHLKLRQPVQNVVDDLMAVLAAEPDNADARTLLGVALINLGDPQAALTALEISLRARPDQPELLGLFGEQLKYAGRRDEAIAAFKRAIALAPNDGALWFRLADTKTYRFTAEEVADLRTRLSGDALAPDQRVFFHYVLAKAADDAGRPAEAFADYALGAALQRALQPHDRGHSAIFTSQCRELFTPAFFEARAGVGAADPAPIFVVGLPRSGSTLIEQILATHSQVEGTTEMPYLGVISERLAATIRSAPYPALLGELEATDFAGLGEAYLDAARGHRRLGRSRFIDKMPENFQHVGLIHLALPNARIIDVRRSPLAGGLAIFRQHFGQGRRYAYDLRDIGLFYRDYVDLMSCWDAALPGRVHRVIYEDLVENPQMEIRRLLDYCGLPFEAECLDFHRTDRAVMTPSAEQVRQPITREGLDKWRAYEPWLGPLKEALGPALEAWRG